MTTKFLELDEPMIPYIIEGTCGMKQVGKSLYSYENGFHVVKQEGGEILWVSTEEPTDFMFTIETDEHPGWEKTFQKKYGIKPVVHFLYLPNAEEVMKFIGQEGKVIITEAEEVKPKPLTPKPGETEEAFKMREAEEKLKAEEKQKGIKLEFKTLNVDTEHSELVKILKAHDIRYIVIDSLTTPFDSLIIGGRQNLGIRAQLQEAFLNTLQFTCYKRGREIGKNIYIMTTNHLSNNPTDPFTFKMIEKELVEKGGKTIGHYHKILYGLKKKITPHGAREFWVIRFPTIPEFGKSYDLLIGNDGFKRTTAKELKEVKAEQKEERKEAKEA